MAYLTRDEILEAKDYQTAEVEVPEWGGAVLVRSLSAFHVQEMGYGSAGPDGEVDIQKTKGVMLKVVAWSVINGDGERLFTEKDVKALGNKDFEPVQRVANAAMKLSGLAEEEEPKKT